MSIQSGFPLQNLKLYIPSSGAEAHILCGYGFNLHSLKLPLGGQVREVLAAEADFAQSPRSPARSGWPVLFPFPNRIREGVYHFGSRVYQIPHPGKPHANHGFALDAPWSLVELGGDDPENPCKVWAEARFRLSEHAPHALAHWPADGELRLRYELTADALTLHATLFNPDERPLPCGLGFHPYFRLPFARSVANSTSFPQNNSCGSELTSDRAQTRLVAPVGALWELVDNLPTGAVLPLDEPRDLASGLSRAQMNLDDVFTSLRFESGVCRVRMEDLTLQSRLVLELSAGFRELVVYTPPAWPDVVAVEPYTQVTDAINLAARGIDGGLMVLEPGESRHFTVRLWGESMQA